MADDDIYDDNETDVSIPMFQKAPALYEPLQDKNVTSSLWFRGNVDRTQAEAEIMDDSVPGNFLVRQKDKSNRLFAHSYLSRTKQKVVHNLIELKQSGEWLVDRQPFSATGLDDLVEQLQARLRRWRKLEDPTPQIRDDVYHYWNDIYLPHLNRNQALEHVKGLCVGSFVIRGSSTPNCLALSVKKDGRGADSMYNGMIVQSHQGWYLKFSELMGNTLEELVMIMIANPERLTTGGVPHALVLPMFQQALGDELYDDAEDVGHPHEYDDRAEYDEAPPPIPGGRPGPSNFDGFDADEDLYSGDEDQFTQAQPEDIYDSSEEQDPTRGYDSHEPTGATIIDDSDTLYDDTEPTGAPPVPGRDGVKLGIQFGSNVYSDDEYDSNEDYPPPINAPKPIVGDTIYSDNSDSEEEDDDDDDGGPPVVRRDVPPPVDRRQPPVPPHDASQRSRYGMPDDQDEDTGPPPVLPPSRGKPKPRLPPPDDEFDEDGFDDDDDDVPPLPGRPPSRGNQPPLPPRPS
eukprot:m.145568 g.145568  ORF g.145568 m.145568 type:complete len:515 (-) comp30445_c0_seq1:140-1684(-)